MIKAFVIVCMTVLFAGSALAENKSPAEYGRVVISSMSQKEGLAPVVFDHWVHRLTYDCRLCHVDIGFGMKANTTGIRAIDNAKGVYCGTCHNGKSAFAACSTDRSDMKRCERCHSLGKIVKKEIDFTAVTAKLPKDKFGNGVNWEKAAEDGLLKPVDYIEGVSLKRREQKIQDDFSIQPRTKGVNEIIFSHRKHSLWNGCESCHPDIFMGGKRGATQYTMKEINAGKFCGACHLAVAFPVADCNRCHSKPVK